MRAHPRRIVLDILADGPTEVFPVAHRIELARGTKDRGATPRLGWTRCTALAQRWLRRLADWRDGYWWPKRGPHRAKLARVAAVNQLLREGRLHIPEPDPIAEFKSAIEKLNRAPTSATIGTGEAHAIDTGGGIQTCRKATLAGRERSLPN